LAWLHSAPKKHKNDDSPQSRVDLLDDDSPAKSLPETDDYLTQCFQLSGMFMSNGMGIAPLSWSELKAFTDLSGYALTGWESEQIIAMSRAFCSMNAKAQKIGCPAPYLNGIDSEDAVQSVRDKVARQWASFEKGLAVKKGIEA